MANTYLWLPFSLLIAGTSKSSLQNGVYRAAGGDAIKPCAEVYLDESSAEQVLACGVMPLMSHRSRNAVRLLRMQSIASPPAPLVVR